jgi:hypothetical protein
MGELIYLEFFPDRPSPTKLRSQKARLAEERNRWLRDLESWPVAFHAGAQRIIERFTDPDTAWSPCGIDVLREARDGSGPYDYPTVIRYRLQSIRSAVRDLREAQEWGVGESIRECWALLEFERDALLGYLWLFGKRRIDRSDIEPRARKQVRRELRRCLDAASSCDEHVRTLRERLARGVNTCEGRAKERRSLTLCYRNALKQQVVGAERIARKHRARATEIRAKNDPLRAWGVYE